MRVRLSGQEVLDVGHPRQMDLVLQRIEALPGDGRYAVTLRRGDGSEQTAVVQVAGESVDIAEASLPPGWTRDSFAAVAAAVLAVDAARRLAPSAAVLHDVNGGWDVSLGNVALSAAGAPECAAHGVMGEHNGLFVCPDCGARAVLGLRNSGSSPGR